MSILKRNREVLSESCKNECRRTTNGQLGQLPNDLTPKIVSVAVLRKMTPSHV